jgi:hypothetical protein
MEGVWRFEITMIVTNQTFKTDNCSFLPLSPRDSDGMQSIQFTPKGGAVLFQWKSSAGGR